MRSSHSYGPQALMLAAVLAGGSAGTAVAQGRITAPLHGGSVVATPSQAFETVLAPDGILVFLHTDGLAPAMVEHAAGTAQLALPDGRTLEVELAVREPADGRPTTYFCPMHTEVVQDGPGRCEPCGGMILYAQDHLFGPADLAGVDLAGVQAMIRITGLRGAQKSATFSPAFPTPAGKAGQATKGPIR